jgi:hypothetical protein
MGCEDVNHIDLAHDRQPRLCKEKEIFGRMNSHKCLKEAVLWSQSVTHSHEALGHCCLVTFSDKLNGGSKASLWDPNAWWNVCSKCIYSPLHVGGVPRRSEVLMIVCLEYCHEHYFCYVLISCPHIHLLTHIHIAIISIVWSEASFKWHYLNIFKATKTDAFAGHLDLWLFPEEVRSRESCYKSLTVYFKDM